MELNRVSFWNGSLSYFFVPFFILIFVSNTNSQNGSCATPNAVYGTSSPSSTQTFNTCINNPTAVSNVITSYHTITSSPNGTLGIVQSIGSLPQCNNNNLWSTRQVFCYALGDCNGTNIPPATMNSGVAGSATFNPEWYNLFPNTQYIIKIIVTVPAACSGNVTSICVNRYYPLPPPACNATIGSFTTQQNGAVVPTTTVYNLSTGETFNINVNGDATLPPPSGGDIAGIGYAAFVCDPATQNLNDINTFNAATNPCFKGFHFAGSFSDINDGSGNSTGVGLGVTTYWIVPITFDDICSPQKSTSVCAGDNSIGIDLDGDGCFVTGTPIQINYIPQSCGTCTTPNCPIYNATSYAPSTSTYPAANKYDPNPDLTGPNTFTNCYSITTTAFGTIGIKQGIVQLNLGCATRTYTLQSSCATAVLPPTRTNANGSMTGFNPEWDNMAAGTYILCITTNLPNSNCDFDYSQTGWYFIPSTPPPTPACPSDQTFVKLDWTQNNPFIPFPNTTYNCNSGPQTIWKNIEGNTIATGGELQAYPGFIMNFTTNGSSSGNTSILVAVNGVNYSYYGPAPAPAGVLDWGPMPNAPTNQLVLEPYLPKGASITITICDKRAAVQSFAYSVWDYALGNVLSSGAVTPNSGNCKTITYTLSSPTITWTLDGSAATITNNNDGSATFDPSTLSSGAHTITYTFNNGAGCTLTANQNINVGATTNAPTVNTPVNYCMGDPSNALTATGSNLLWYTVASGGAGSATAPLPSTASAGTTSYWVSQTANGCESPRAKIDIIVTSCTCPVNLVVNDPAAVCSPNTIDLSLAAVTSGSTGGGGFSYFTDNAGLNPLNNYQAVGTSGVYWIKQDNGSCSDIKAVNVTIHLLPNLLVTNPSPVCFPGTLDLSAPAVTAGSDAGTLTYWMDNIASVNQLNYASINSSSINYIKLTDINSCSSIQPVNTVVNNSPNLMITDPSAVCSPATVDLSLPAVTAGSDPGTFTYWSDANASVTLNNYTAVTSTSINYIKLTDNNSCSDILPVNVVINSSPSLIITDPNSTCSPNSVSIQGASVTAGSSAGTLTYWTDNLASNQLLNPGSIAASGVYYIKLDNGACADVQPVNVFIYGLPQLSLMQQNQSCPGVNDGSVTITASGGSGTTNWTYSINGGTSFVGSNSFNSLSPGNYTILVLDDISGCTNSIASSIVAAKQLTVSSLDTVCKGSNITLTASGVTPITWVNLGNGQVSSGNTYTTILNTATSISVSDNCSSGNPVQKTIEVFSNPSISLSSNQAFCIGDSATLLASVSGGQAAYSFAWSPSVGSIVSAGNSSSMAVKPGAANTYTYYASVTDRCWNTDSKSVVVTVHPLPEAEIVGQEAICAGNSIQFSNVKHNASITKYDWDFGSFRETTIASANPVFTNAGIYSLILNITDNNNCKNSSASVNFEVLENPVAAFTISDLERSILNPVIWFDASGSYSDIAKYEWNFGGFDGSFDVNPNYAFPDTGIHLVSLKVTTNYSVSGEEYACTDVLEKTIKIKDELALFIPNAFTPNGDLDNDEFAPKGFGFLAYEMQIFNRWGEQIFITKNIEEGWDGSVDGGANLANEDVYVYLIKLETANRKEKEKFYTGHVSLLR